MFQTCLSLVQEPVYPERGGPNYTKRKDAHDQRPTREKHSVFDSSINLPVRRRKGTDTYVDSHRGRPTHNRQLLANDVVVMRDPPASKERRGMRVW